MALDTAWKDFHDATIVNVYLEWRAATAVIECLFEERVPRSVEVVVHGCKSLVCPRRMPWYESDLINEVRQGRRDDGGVRLEIEIQSGDVIEVEGERAEIRVGESPSRSTP